WYSTRDTAQVLYAMSDFLKVSRELSPDYDAEVLVNGKSVATKHFGKESVKELQFEADIPSQLLHNGKNILEIRKQGSGVVYYNANLTQYLQHELTTPPAGVEGLSITREYFRPSRKYYENHDPGSPVNNCEVGDVVLVRLTIDTKKPLEHLLFEDFIPAGCEILDRGDLGFESWSYWWCGQDVRDDRISFYLEDLDKGREVIEYQMRGSFAGKYHALPAQVFQMYRPEVRAATRETEFTVR
ncbi:MAG TPA: hypothetical protein VGK34_05560, partial [Armatimonadota bacterium]